jgi:hypothetical protein
MTVIDYKEGVGTEMVDRTFGLYFLLKANPIIKGGLKNGRIYDK